MSKTLITSALPYINGIKHLGNLVGSMLPADVYARFCRQCGDDVLYICATDEHGTPAELAAAKAGQNVEEYCADQHQIQKDLGDGFGLSFDYFGRSSAKSNHALTQQFAIALEKEGFIEERESEQIFSIADNRFLPDRYVEGTCPHCGFERARGDQCDQCGRLLDPKDLKNPISKISGSTDLEVRKTKHLYLCQEKMSAKIRDWVETCDQWPQLARSIALKWLDEGLQDRAITRDLSWGIDVVDIHGQPREGFENKVYYVWFDAPIAYIAATQDWANETTQNWKNWWRLDKEAADVSYVQFMGKDNVAFHTISFPITLIGANQPWKMVDKLKAFNWLNWYGGKFSTSEQRGVFMDHALELLPADLWRWWLIANAPESSDTQFTFEQFAEGINKDLADNLGNCVNRITKFCASKFDGKVPENGEYGDLEREFEVKLKALINQCHTNYSEMNFRKAAQSVRAVWSLANDYVTQAAPWSQFKSDQDAAAQSIRFALNLNYIMAVVARPIIPQLGKAILDILGVDQENCTWPEADQDCLMEMLPKNTALNLSGPLVQKIDDEQLATWVERFGGVTSTKGTQETGSD